MGSHVFAMPLSGAELRVARGLLELVAWELGAAELRDLSELRLRRRRVFLVREEAGAWLFDVIEGSGGLLALGPESVWATSDTALDRWIAARSPRSSVVHLRSLPEIAPALDLRVPTSSGRVIVSGTARHGQAARH